MKDLDIPQATSPLASWLYYLEHLHAKAIELGLDRVRTVADNLGLFRPAPYIFTVAGTNGKGTTCRALETILMAQGYRVGVYSSPHLIRYSERVRIQGQELAEHEHTQAFALIEKGRGDISLTYFEYGTLSALQLFKQSGLDVVILEVGLGGRLDATNIVDADVAVVTSIALDHTDWLGCDRESIGREKAGIFRAGKPAVVGEPDMPVTICDVAVGLNAPLYRRGYEWSFELNSLSGEWCWQSGNRRLERLPLPNVPVANAATALAALHYSSLKISDSAIIQGLNQASLPGRFQTVGESPLRILDVAHNPHAAGYLAERLAALPDRGGKIYAVVGMLSDKDIEGTLALLKPLVDVWYCASLDGPRGAKAERLAQYLPGSSSFADVIHAWQQALKDAKPQDVIIVCGSFHTVAHVMEALELEKGEQCG
ncbi:bifunctional tetrahydrofolate synthase/dihydrofolate synthase [Budvicia diplopodorum]|uniref:bifunctional tetrahydrofolate synthase/dihydrofolate synthase n=1 Tax=Budvicia diplopodorum TaxID=1119056 RepID=UPI001356CFE5|nr:bifunctional tetrahydrofolate synthase/dihydrofolate synthase [Budvicia diplopodorum]